MAIIEQAPGLWRGFCARRPVRAATSGPGGSAPPQPVVRRATHRVQRRFLTLALPCALLLVYGVQEPCARAQAKLPAAAAGLPADPGNTPAPASAGHAASALPPVLNEGAVAAHPLEPGVVPTLASLVPGIVLRGSGTFLAKDRRSARRLFSSAAAGLVLFVGGGAVLAATGTSRRLVSTFTPVVFLGSALIFSSWLADIYGASTGGRDAVGQTVSPALEWELGYRYVYDPQFAYRSFAFARGDLRHGAWRASPSAHVALDDDNQRWSLDLARRLHGRDAREQSDDGSYVDVTHGLLYHRYGSERFAVWTPTLALEGRLDLRHVGSSLRGAFVEGQLGAGVEVYAFDATGTQAREDVFGLLLARWAFGVYFGRGRERTGEATVYYDHRHDDFAAGLGVDGIASGIVGHIGTTGHYWFHEQWGVSALLEVGSAVVTGISARYRAMPRVPRTP